MDKTLAEIYGTNQVEEADVEKLAAAELAEQLTETGDAQIDDETLEALAQEVLAQDDGETTDENAVSEPEMDEAQEKIAEADYLGRVMAHSFVQESKEIEKEAMEKEADLGDVIPQKPAKKPQLHREGFKGTPGPSGPAAAPAKKGFFGRAADSAKAGGTKAMNWAKANPKKAIGGGVLGAAALTAGALAAKKHKEKNSGVKDSAKAAWGKAKDTAGKVGRHVAKNKKWYGAGAGAAAIGAGAYAAKKYKDKHSSAVDTLAEQRALEVLAEAGYDVDAVLAAVEQYEAPAEKVAEATEGAYDVLAQTVEARAEEMLNELVEAGIIAVPEETEE